MKGVGSTQRWAMAPETLSKSDGTEARIVDHGLARERIKRLPKRQGDIW
jgi:hypothetical protein